MTDVSPDASSRAATDASAPSGCSPCSTSAAQLRLPSLGSVADARESISPAVTEEDGEESEEAGRLDRSELPQTQSFHNMLEAQLNSESDSDPEGTLQHKPDAQPDSLHCVVASPPRPFWQNSLLGERSPQRPSTDSHTSASSSHPCGTPEVTGIRLSPVAGGNDVPRQLISHLLPGVSSSVDRLHGAHADAGSGSAAPQQSEDEAAESEAPAVLQPLPAPEVRAARQDQEVAKQELNWGSDDDSDERPKKAARKRAARRDTVAAPVVSTRPTKRSAAEAGATSRSSAAKHSKVLEGSVATKAEPVSSEIEPLANAEEDAPRRKRLTKKTHPSEWVVCVKEESRPSLPRSLVKKELSETQPARLGMKEEPAEGRSLSTSKASADGMPPAKKARVKTEKRPSKGKRRVKAEDAGLSGLAEVTSAAEPVPTIEDSFHECGEADEPDDDNSKRGRGKGPLPAKGTRAQGMSPKQEKASPGSAHGSTASASPSSRPAEQYCFTATGLELGTKYRRQLRSKLGVKFVDEWSPDITHLLADTFRRTTKMMSAICTGARVVTPDYIDECLKAGCLVDDAPFALNDPVCEAAFAKKHGLPRYSLQEALEESRRSGPLLDGVDVHCSQAVVGRSEMKTLVHAAGARWLRQVPECPPHDGDAQPVLLLSKAGAEPPPRHAERWRLHTAYDAELLREAACTQKLRYDVYRL